MERVWDHLVDSNGKLIQAELKYPIPSLNMTKFIKAKFSGFGEPNVIVDPFPNVAPIYTSTPGPSPTPDPLATVTPTPTATAAATVTPTALPTLPPTSTLDFDSFFSTPESIALPTPETTVCTGRHSTAQPNSNTYSCSYTYLYTHSNGHSVPDQHTNRDTNTYSTAASPHITDRTIRQISNTPRRRYCQIVSRNLRAAEHPR